MTKKTKGGQIIIETQEATPSYFIDQQWLEENHRFFQKLAETRLCQGCRWKLEDDPEMDRLQAIRECCSQADDFLPPGLPLLEAVFRLCLAAGNEPQPLDQLYRKVQEWLTRNGDLRLVSLNTLKRMLDSDCYYGIRQVPSPG